MGCKDIGFVSAVIVAGGKGERLGRDVRKQYIMLGDYTILGHTLWVFTELEEVGEVIVVVPPEDLEFVRDVLLPEELGEFMYCKPISVATGGATRQDSVRNGLAAVDPNANLVMIHDAARPFVQKNDIRKVLQKACECGGAILAVPVKDTLKRCDKDGSITGTIPRTGLYAAQTPQAFDVEKIRYAHNWAVSENVIATDDAMLFEKLGYEVAVAEGSCLNIKITTEEDLLFARAIDSQIRQKQ
ncbi:MAG: 2-C-methyl-D-erythritol 4-phosphate cytidylyltransferase [Defluviitaleaceae bacterium]|nr:2-C-methyl-D-erythritol 4-phosphate cytidylyltransferase [Defluviitaleaceae bacterium]